MKNQRGIVIVASLGLLFSASAIQATEAPQERDMPAVMMGAGTTTTATVEAIDHETRAVTLRSESGQLVDFIAGDEVRNLAQVRVGDRVMVSYQVGLVMALSPSGSGVRQRHDTVEMGRAEPGQKPAGVVRKTVEVTATVRGVDMKERTVTLQGPQHTVTLPVAEDIDLNSIKVGDQVDAMYRESLAIKVESAPAMPGK